MMAKLFLVLPWFKISFLKFLGSRLPTKSQSWYINFDVCLFFVKEKPRVVRISCSLCCVRYREFVTQGAGRTRNKLGTIDIEESGGGAFVKKATQRFNISPRPIGSGT
ncbi:hypothetical protein BDV19DRAFT_24744 [Aspergillus venezuelensis]